jgi:hypothetical protein
LPAGPGRLRDLRRGVDGQVAGRDLRRRSARRAADDGGTHVGR